MKHWYQRFWGILLIIFLLFLLSCIGGVALFVYNRAIEINQENFQQQQATQQKLIEGYKPSGALAERCQPHWTGTSTPKVTIVEFGDFACPHCQAVYETVEAMALKYKNDIKIIFRNLPLHDNSIDLAMAAACAGEQTLPNKDDGFWPMHDLLFMKQGQITKDDLPTLAKQIGLNVNLFNTCLAQNRYAVCINQDSSDAAGLGAVATPTWFINDGSGYKEIEGEITAANFITLIDKFLKTATTTPQ